MNQQNTVESRVLSILKDCPRARFDDMVLVMHYYNRYATYLRAGELPLNDLAFNYKVYGLPCFETIRRARQRVQSLFPEYSRNANPDDDSTGQWSMKRMQRRNARKRVSIPCTTIRLTLWWIAMPGNLRKI